MIKRFAIAVALVFGVSAEAHAADVGDDEGFALLRSMMADLATYESCARSSARKYLSSGASATEIAITADRDCAVYTRYYNDRLETLAATPGLSSQQSNDLLNHYRSTAEEHHDGVRRDIIAEVVSTRSKQ